MQKKVKKKGAILKNLQAQGKAIITRQKVEKPLSYKPGAKSKIPENS